MWFLYPLLLLLGLAYLGKKIIKVYQRGDPAVAVQKGSDLLADPNSPAGRAEFSRRVFEFSGDLQQWNEQMTGGGLFLSEWIRHQEQYRAFEAQKRGEELSVNFVDDSLTFGGDLRGGEIVPLDGYLSPSEDPMARALAFLLDSFWGKRICHHAIDAMDEATLESRTWKSRDCLSFDFNCILPLKSGRF